MNHQYEIPQSHYATLVTTADTAALAREADAGVDDPPKGP